MSQNGHEAYSSYSTHFFFDADPSVECPSDREPEELNLSQWRDPLTESAEPVKHDDLGVTSYPPPFIWIVNRPLPQVPFCVYIGSGIPHPPDDLMHCIKLYSEDSMMVIPIDTKLGGDDTA